MRTHPDSVWLRTVDVDHAKESEWTNDAVVTHSEAWVRSDEIEFVPAAAYLELRAQLEAAQTSACGFESLYDAAYDELAKLKATVEKAMGVIERHGGTDESHHKAWVIDQVARALTGDGYEKWVDCMKGSTGDDGEREYDWDEGIVP